MKSKIYIFKNFEDAIGKLNTFTTKWKPKEGDDLTIIDESVSANIFRALSVESKQPSVVYRNWAKQNSSIVIKKIKRCSSQKEYDTIVFQYADSLIGYWKEQTNGEKIGYGPAIKMVNLLIKRFFESGDKGIHRKKKYLHVPFDLYSLLPLREVINDISGKPYKISIPGNVSMSYITTKEVYVIIHDAVTILCKKAKIDRIDYDFWAWNRTHR